MKVVQVVEFDEKDLKDTLLDKAKVTAGPKAGGSSIELLYNDAEVAQAATDGAKILRRVIGARVSFTGVANK